MFGLSPFEMAFFGIVAVVLFGGNLPDVARKLGTSYASLRSSLADVQKEFRMAQDEVTSTIQSAAPDAESIGDSSDDEDSPSLPTAPKFKPPA